MKKMLILVATMFFVGSVANADPFSGAMIDPIAPLVQSVNATSVFDMQQLGNQYRSEKGSYSEFKDFKQQQKENQERIQKDIDRQKALEERAQYGSRTHSKFVNDNGVIKIESY